MYPRACISYISAGIKQAYSHFFIEAILCLHEAAVPTTAIFLNHVIHVNSQNQVIRIWTILSALFTQVNLELQRPHPFPNLLPRDTMQHFARPY